MKCYQGASKIKSMIFFGNCQLQYKYGDFVDGFMLTFDHVVVIYLVRIQGFC